MDYKPFYQFSFRILLGVVIILLAGYFYYFITHSFLTHEFSIGNKTYIINENHVEFTGGHSFDFPSAIGNLPTENKSGNLSEVSRIWLSGAGQQVYYASVSNVWPNEIQLYNRKVVNLFGQELLNYQVRIDVSQYPENKYLCSFYASGGGSADYTVKAVVESQSSDGFALRIQEYLYGDMFDYVLDMNFESEEISIRPEYLAKLDL